MNFGDKRLYARWIDTAERLSGQPLDPINKVCENWADTKAAYRLFATKKVEPAQILRVHQQKVMERMKDYKVILAV